MQAKEVNIIFSLLNLLTDAINHNKIEGIRAPVQKQKQKTKDKKRPAQLL